MVMDGDCCHLSNISITELSMPLADNNAAGASSSNNNNNNGGGNNGGGNNTPGGNSAPGGNSVFVQPAQLTNNPGYNGAPANQAPVQPRKNPALPFTVAAQMSSDAADPLTLDAV